jgi:hypothetical protein
MLHLQALAAPSLTVQFPAIGSQGPPRLESTDAGEERGAARRELLTGIHPPAAGGRVSSTRSSTVGT